jgi:hopene-associated glycosyltransferase HpnB
MIAACIGAVSLLTWVYLLLARGGFWLMRTETEPSAAQESAARRIAIIVPARDEATAVAQAVRSLLRQNYPDIIHIFLVDDHSSDGTAEIARQAAHDAGASDWLSVVEGRPLPQGWAGKLWAVSQGLQAAASFGAEYYLFTDADIVHEPDNLRSLVLRAERGGFDLVSLMVKLHCESLAERMLIPAFVFFFFKLYPPAWVARPERRTAAAAGGCMLIRSSALARIGGIAAIRDQLIDDCALARAVKSGGRIWLGPTAAASSLRRYQSWTEIGRMISRTAFTQLRHSTILLFAVCAGMALTYLAPPILIFFGLAAAAFGAATWLLQSIAYWPTLRFYGLSPLWAPLLPLASLFYLGATVFSALQYWRGRGGLWKGRVQDPASPRIR